MRASCPDTEKNDLEIENSDTGIWTIKVTNAHIEFLLDGELVTSCEDACLMSEVHATNVIQFGAKDDISKSFRLQLDPCTEYPSDWNHVEPSSAGEEIDAGSKVTVECKATRVNKGGSEVTCTSGNQWEFEEKPDCVLQCTGFDETYLPNMFSPSLPAYEGAQSMVTCFAGTFQLGGEHVVCVSGEEFSYDTKPDCRVIGSFHTKTSVLLQRES
ncbi:uncharacterized protein LOC134819805 [Bolinopsis microptera]|uniref:uncharacterized protein LOC134819805 n=1 Tax=Bolinopsis microptera TaxID=2820187 RepID=UPI003079BCC6